MNINNSDLQDILFYAFRYALGRKTYASYDVSQALIKYKEVLHENTIEKIKEEIQEAIDDGKAGMDMDVAEWKKVLGAL